MLKYNQTKGTSVPPLKNNRFFFQPKLTVNQPNDAYEQEADAVADKVMRMEEDAQSGFFRPAGLSVQRKCERCEKAEKQVQRQDGNVGVMDTAVTENYLGAPSGGRKLTQSERSFFEPKIGHDFSRVKLYTDGAANESARSIGAKAYTHGSDIVFAAGQYQPHTTEGKRLLAHELTHVVQQQQLPQTIQRERELNADESKACYQKIDETIRALEAKAADPDKQLPDYIKEAIQVLREKRNAGKVKCYAFEGIKHGRMDFTKDEIQYDGIDTGWINETAVLHEAVHALHGKKYSASAKQYGKAVDDKKQIDPAKAGDLELLKFKAWTEYWAYRSSQEYNNEQQRTEEDIHNAVMKIREVMIAVNAVRAVDANFDVRKWKPK